VVRADVLRDAARLTRGHFRLADVIEQRGLAVIDVAHDGDHGRTRRFGFRRALALQVFFDLVALSTLAMWPISSTTSVAVSRSMGWLMVAITPMLSMVLMTSVALTAIFCAISCGVMVSPMVTSRFIGAVGISKACASRAHAAGAVRSLTRFFFLLRAPTPPATCSSWRP
jgi:hypothetical protein